jgi:hypothetical protein
MSSKKRGGREPPAARALQFAHPQRATAAGDQQAIAVGADDPAGGAEVC